MKTHDWFVDRIGKEAQVIFPDETIKEFYVLNEIHIDWLLSSQEFGYEYLDSPSSPPNVCIACEG